MDQVVVSIIIPVYNTEKYLEDCINSLINQTFKACEFIFVNDGSTDTSLSILKQFALVDNRIILINQSNAGVSEARNNALAIAKGKYIGFVDADDWIELDMYQVLVNEIEWTKCDVVLCNMINNQNGIDYVNKYPFITDRALSLAEVREEIIPHLIRYDDLYSSCNKLFKASIIKENSVRFPPKNALSEDNIFNILYFSKIESFKYVDYSGYNYREVEGSATRNIASHDYFKNVINIFKFDFKAYLDLKISDEELMFLKSEKLIKNVLSLIHIYFKSTEQLPFRKRVSYIRNMINDVEVQNAIYLYFDSLTKNESKYVRFLIQAIKDKSVWRLYVATKYSMLRNK